MSKLKIFEGIVDIIRGGANVVLDYVKEPLEGWRHEREMEKDRSRMNIDSQNKLKEMNEESSIKIREKDVESQNKLREMNEGAKIRAQEKELEVDLSIRKETELEKIRMLLEEFKKDKDLQREVAISDAIIKYRKELTELNVNAINAISHMQLDLKDRALQLVYEKTIKYKMLQDQSLDQAMDDLKRVESDFCDGSAAKEILIQAVGRRLANVLDIAQSFLEELNSDIKMMNQRIDSMTERGQIFIENHLKGFHVIGSPMAMDMEKKLKIKVTGVNNQDQALIEQSTCHPTGSPPDIPFHDTCPTTG